MMSICGSLPLQSCFYKWMAHDNLRNFQMKYNNMMHEFFAREETELVEECGAMVLFVPSLETSSLTQLSARGTLTLGKCRYRSGDEVETTKHSTNVVMVVASLK